MPGKKCVNAEKKYTNGSEPRQEKVICSFLHVSHPICKKPRCADRLPRGQTYVIATWKKEETECQVTDVWQEDKLAQRRAGSRSACFSGYTPGRTMERRTLPWCKKRYKEHSWTFIKNALVHKRYTARLNVCMSTRSPSSSWRRWSAKSPCLPPPDLQSPQQCASRDNLSSPPKLSLVYSEPSISASERCHPLRSANYAILSAEAPPKLPFCYNQTPSQSDNVPATPTCHRHSQPRDNLLGSRNMTRFGPKSDIHHVIESRKLTTFYKIIYNFTSWMLKLADI